MGRVFANDPGDPGSILGQVIPKTSNMVSPCLTLGNIRYISRVKWSNPRKGVAPSSYTLKREPSGRPCLRSSTLLTFTLCLLGHLYFLLSSHIDFKKNLCTEHIHDEYKIYMLIKFSKIIHPKFPKMPF